MSDLVRVEIDTESDAYPELSIVESPDRGLIDIPRELWTTLRTAQAQVDEAERAIMSYVGEHYPDVSSVREWLRDHEGSRP